MSLSATVSNAEEFGDWLVTVRGDTDGRRRGAPAGPAVAARAGRRPAVRPVRRRTGRRSDGSPGQPRAGAARPRGGPVRPVSGRSAPARGGRRGARRSRRCPSRVEVVERLDREGLLPAITFIFSRAGCDAAVAAVPARRAAAERRRRSAAEVRAFVEARCADIPRRGPARPRLPRVARGPGARRRRPPRRHAADLQGGRRGAVRPRPGQGGVRHRDARARHQHAGPLGRAGAAGQVERREPRRRHAGGVHPAHRPGRAARHRRRGPRRRAVAAGPRPAAARRARVAPAPTRCAPASGRRTTWRSTWSARSAGERARELLESSFAQFQADRAVVGLARQVRAQRGGARGLPRGDDLPPRRLRGVRRAAPRRSPTARRSCPAAARPTGGPQAAASLETLRPGDVIQVPAGRRGGLAVVLDPGTAGGARRPAADGAHRRAAGAPAVAGRLPGAGRAAGPAADPARRSTRAPRPAGATWPPRCAAPGWPRRRPARPARPRSAAADDDELAAAARRAARAPVPRLRRARGPRPLGRALPPAARARPTRCERRVEGRTHTIARTFDRICALLHELGYLRRRRGHRPHGRAAGRGSTPSSTCWPPSACATGVWDGLSAGRAGRVRLGPGLRVAPRRRRRRRRGCRRAAPGRCSPRRCGCGGRWRSASATHRLDAGPRAGPRLRLGGLPLGVRAPRWTRCCATPTCAPGDFVRWTKQVIDLLGQIADASRQQPGAEPVGAAARKAADLLRRGVVAYSSVA